MDVDLEAVLARIRADRVKAENQIRTAQSRLDELASMEAHVTAAMRAAEEYGQGIQATERADRRPVPETNWASLTNKEAALKALNEIGRPASTREIYNKLRSVGRTEVFDQVRAALGDLKRRGQLTKASRELWQPPSPMKTRTGVPANVTELHRAQSSGSGHRA